MNNHKPHLLQNSQKSYFVFKIYFIGELLIYNVVSISVVQPSVQSHTHPHPHTHIQIYIFFFVFSIMVYHRVLNIVPCAIQQVLVVYPLYTKLLHLLILNSQFIPPLYPFSLSTTVCSRESFLLMLIISLLIKSLKVITKTLW